MIWFYSGTPGSGKSLNSARAIYFNLFKYKRDVIANFEINRNIYDKKRKKGDFTFVSNKDLTAKKLIQMSIDRGYFAKKEEGQCLVVIDEASIIFNSRNWNSPGRMDWLDFFVHHRKYGYNIIIISQFSGQIDKQIREIFEYEFIHRKLTNYGFMRLIPFNVFMVIEKAARFKMKNSTSMFLYSKKYANLYDTYHTFTEIENSPTS